MALKDETVLAQAEEDGAFLVVASDATETGKPRRVDIQRTQQIQQEVNPLLIKTERVLLGSWDTSNFASTTANILLPIKEGTTRWNWDDFLKVEFQVAGTNTNLPQIPRPLSVVSWKATRTNSRFNIYEISGQLMQVWFANTTAFRLDYRRSNNAALNQNVASYLKAVYGYRFIVDRQNNG